MLVAEWAGLWIDWFPKEWARQLQHQVCCWKLESILLRVHEKRIAGLLPFWSLCSLLFHMPAASFDINAVAAVSK